MNFSDLVIREIGPDDAEAVAELSGELGYPMDPASMRRNIADLAGSAEHVVFAACLAGRVVAWIDVVVARHLVSAAQAEIAGLVVSGDVRSRGIGKLLVARAEQWAAERGLPAMLVRSRITREDAHRFYLREGYTRIKTSAVFRKELARSPV